MLIVVSPCRFFLSLLSASLLLSFSSLALSADATPVSVAKAINAPLIEEVPLTGTVTSPQSAVLSVAVGGLVEKMYLDVGARVQVGTPLMQLDTEFAEIALSSGRASLASAEASLAEANRRVEEAQPLIKQNNIAATEVRARETQVKIAQAEFDRASATLKRQSAELARHKVLAPFSGVISRKLTEVGEWVSPGSDVMELVSINNLRVDYQVPQNYFPRINDQASLIARFDALPDAQYESEIISTVPINNANARTFLLRVSLKQNDIAVTPGMSAQGILQLHSGREGVVVPRDALIRYSDGRIVVWIVDQSGEVAKVKEQLVTIGLSAGGLVEIKSGVDLGAWVVTRGNESLRPGQIVSIFEETHTNVQATSE